MEAQNSVVYMPPDYINFMFSLSLNHAKQSWLLCLLPTQLIRGSVLSLNLEEGWTLL